MKPIKMILRFILVDTELLLFQLIAVLTSAQLGQNSCCQRCRDQKWKDHFGLPNKSFLTPSCIKPVSFQHVLYCCALSAAALSDSKNVS